MQGQTTKASEITRPSVVKSGLVELTCAVTRRHTKMRHCAYQYQTTLNSTYVLA